MFEITPCQCKIKRRPNYERADTMENWLIFCAHGGAALGREERANKKKKRSNV